MYEGAGETLISYLVFELLTIKVKMGLHMTPLTAGTVQGLQLCLVKEAEGEALPLSPGEQGQLPGMAGTILLWEQGLAGP